MRRLLAALVSVLLVAAAVPAGAGGLFLPVHGIRPLGRGGAFTAGGDDAGVLWYNPANLDLCGNQSLTELAVVAGHQRYGRIDSGGNALADVASTGDPMPIPTAAVALKLRRDLTLGLGFGAPYSALPRYRPDGAQRYSLIDLDGTFMARLDAALAWRLYDGGERGPRITVGASLQDMVLNFESRSALNACPGTVVTAPEDPQCDARAALQLSTFFNPSASVGAHLDWRWLRAGAGFQLPVWVSGTGTIRSGIPTHELFRDLDGEPTARQEGDQAELSFTLPWVLRLGVEVRPTPRLRAEAELDYEGWSMHDAIRIEPHDVRLADINGIDAYEIGPMAIVRHFEDVLSVRLGVEWDALPERLTVRGGWAYEGGAAPPAYLSVVTVDLPKQLLALGLSWRPGRAWRVDAAYAHVFEQATSVPLEEARACQLTPLRPEPACTPVNAGTYRASYDVAGAAVVYEF